MGVRSPLLKSYGDDFAWSLLDAAPDATLIVAGTPSLATLALQGRLGPPGSLFGRAAAETNAPGVI